MLITDDEATKLREWLRAKLRDNSDADPEILAEYVAAMLQTDGSEADLRRNCTENLKDFLPDEVAAKLVIDLFEALRLKSYMPDYVPPSTVKPTSIPKPAPSIKSASNLRSTAPSFTPTAPALKPTAPSFKPTAPSFKPSADISNKPSVAASSARRPPPTGPSNSTQINSIPASKKRTYNELASSDPQDGQGRLSSARPVKQTRRTKDAQQSFAPSYNAPSNAYNPPNHAMATQDMSNMSNMSYMPPFDSSGMMPFQPMQFGMGMPQMPPPVQQRSSQTGKRCFDYDTKGFCAKGSTCPYEHGEDRISVPTGPAADLAMPGFDPQFLMAMNNPMFIQSMMAMAAAASDPTMPPVPGNRTSHRSNKRSEFSSTGPIAHTAKDTLVVEQIPPEYTNEEAVRDFFSKFGSIDSVQVIPYRNIAIVKYSSHTFARAAYESPKVIFDNRFVKVYWFRSHDEEHVALAAEVPKAETPMEEDPKDVQARIDAAQLAYEAKRLKIDDARAQKEELQAQMRANARGRKELIDKLARVGNHDLATSVSPSTVGDDGGPATDADVLRMKLAALEAEAERMGIDPNDPSQDLDYGYSEYRGRGRGRGWRGGYSGRARGYGGFRGGRAGPAVFRLDNRPKKVVVNIAEGSDEDAKLREYMLHAFEVDAITAHPTKPNCQIISFRERYMAESFISEAQSALGKLELAWFTDATSNGAPQEPGESDQNDADIMMSEATNGDGADKGQVSRRVEEHDLDVAEDDDDDRWMG
ncbi:hypothetical protein BT63DRAFT_279651 [Microthyrium microscopicum]|uniref:RNA-binding domain-containing protein n=1 Tax=Microthyrium microscopicum TaxID=703497 RepID=A0A6A6U8D9_9PEZI|nr:hypothetical protein BT63DRAFT_279651 [Microthyrium microscopicum]